MDKENVEDLILSSSNSTRISLYAVRQGKAGLDEHRKKILDRIPNSGDWACFEHDSIVLKDLAYLSAKTGDEFALLRGKKEDILFHGTKIKCSFYGLLYDMLMSHKLALIGHSHPGEDDPVASSDDRSVLRTIGQKSSFIISGRTGRITEYTWSLF